MKPTTKILLLCMGIIAIALSGCQKKDSLDELKQEMVTIKNKMMAQSAPLPKLEKVQPVSYQSSHLSSPFVLRRLASTDDRALQAPLRQFSLAELKYLGMMSHYRSDWAVIATPDQRVYRVSVGDVIGQEGASVITIQTDKVLVKIPNRDGKGTSERTLFAVSDSKPAGRLNK